MISAAGAGYGTINYAYDSIGNMTSRSSLRDGGAVEAISYTYGEGAAGPHAVTSSLRAEGEAISISYDANGNMTSKTVIASPQGEAISTYSYDIENRLTEVAEPKEEYISNYNIPLQTGYNFVSIPLVVTDNIETILNNSGITDAEVSRLNAQTGEWEFFVFDNAQVFGTPDFTVFDYGRGYEIYVESNCTLTFSGVTPLTDKTLELYSGDNLIAAPTTTSVSVEEALAGVTYVSVKAASSLRGVQDPEAISYVDVTELQAGYSYFIKVATQQTWNIPREKDKTTYVYDGDGGRVMSLRTPKLRGEAISTTYIGSSYETSLRAGGEAISKKHIFMGSTRVCTVETVGTTTDYFYFHQDHIGSSNVITDETGQLAKLIEYSPYGLTAREEGSYNTDYKFTGKLFDTSTELYYYGARYYDPELGRFIQPDTIVPYPSDPQSFNRYSYARNNPIRYIDPTGHAWWNPVDWFKKAVDFVQDIMATVSGWIDSAIAWLENATGSGWDVSVSVSKSTSFGPGGDGGPGTYDPSEPLFASSAASSHINIYSSVELSLLNAANLLKPTLVTPAGQDELAEDIKELVDFGLSPEAATIVAGQRLSTSDSWELWKIAGYAGKVAGYLSKADAIILESSSAPMTISAAQRFKMAGALLTVLSYAKPYYLLWTDQISERDAQTMVWVRTGGNIGRVLAGAGGAGMGLLGGKALFPLGGEVPGAIIGAIGVGLAADYFVITPLENFILRRLGVEHEL